MALDVLRGRSARSGESDPVDDAMEIGAPDAEIISCLTCSRPIAASAGRCPGCGTRYLLGVPYRRAGVFVTVGAVVGLLFGGTAVGTAMTVANIDSTPTDRPVASVAPGASQAPVASGGPVVDAPPAALSALRQAVAIDARLVSGVDALRSSLAAKPFESFAVASTLRALAADAAVGADAANRMRTWADAAPVQAQLAALYDAVRRVSRDALSSALANTDAYRASADAMLGVLAQVAAADAAARTLGESAGLELPAPLSP
jgi:hypothetical protein